MANVTLKHNTLREIEQIETNTSIAIILFLGYSDIITTAPRDSDIYSLCEDKIFANLPGFEPTPAGPSQVFSLTLCSLSYWSLWLNDLQILA